MQENGGISGIILFQNNKNINNIGTIIYSTLYSLQHRGQKSVGIFIDDFKNNKFIIKKKGIISSISMNKIIKIDGYLAIGNIGDTNKNKHNIDKYQPFIVNENDIKICISYVGNIINRTFLIKKIFEDKDINYNKKILDYELISKLLLKELKSRNNIDAIKYTLNTIVGSYCIIISINNNLYAIRDPYGVRPLCYGKINNSGYIIASESSTIDMINGGVLIRDVKPGEIIEFDYNGDIKHYTLLSNKKKISHCIFEYIYLARPDSIIDNKLVYTVRENFGKQLAKEYKVDCDIVCPIPDSGIISAIGYSNEAKIKYTESIIKNKYIGRTFILPTFNDRDIALMFKMNFIKENIYSKKIMIIDDSIVRGTTIKKIIPIIKRLNPKEIHIGISSPKIVNSCCFGVNIQNKNELFSKLYSNNEILSLIKCDSLKYLSIDGFIESIGLNKNNLCLNCITNKIIEL